MPARRCPWSRFSSSAAFCSAPRRVPPPMPWGCESPHGGGGGQRPRAGPPRRSPRLPLCPPAAAGIPGVLGLGLGIFSFSFFALIRKTHRNPGSKVGPDPRGGRSPRRGPPPQPRGLTPPRLKSGAVPPGGVPCHPAEPPPRLRGSVVPGDDGNGLGPGRSPSCGRLFRAHPRPFRQQGDRRGLRPCTYSAIL